MMAQKRPPSDQLTLFQCIRQDTSKDHSSKKQCHGLESTTGSSSSSQDSDNCPAASGQSNYINIQNPSGPTTVIVNQAQEPCANSCNERQTLEAPDDIAATPAYPPVRPVNINIQQHGHLVQDGITLILGWSTL